MTEESVEDLALLVKEQVFKRALLLFVEKLFHNLQEVACKDGQRVLIFIEESTK